MKRRDFLVLVTGTLLSPVTSRAQEPGRIYRVGSLFHTPRSNPNLAALFEGLRQYGFVEGQNLLADPKGYGLRD